MKVAVFGGSFDLPHLAHQVACLLLLQGQGMDEVWLQPTFRHAFGKQLQEFEHRLNMCRLLVAPFADRVRVLETERLLARQRPPGAPNWTESLIDHLQANHPDLEFHLVIGSDLLAELPDWRNFDRLRERLPWLVLERPGAPAIDRSNWSADFHLVTPALPDVSSSDVRGRIARGQSLTGRVPGPVIAYIRSNNLYVSGPRE